MAFLPPQERRRAERHAETIGRVITDLRRRVNAGEPDIPIEDFKIYQAHVGDNAYRILMEQWDAAQKRRQVRELIAECTKPLENHEGVAILNHRTNRLLAAILEKLHAAD